MSGSDAQLYTFGAFCVDPIKRLLLKEGQPIAVPAKAFDTLLVLLEYRGSVVERNELMAKLWPDTFVEEINLNVHISALRKALGESPTEHRYIVTVPRRGYSFVAEVARVETRSEPGSVLPSQLATADQATAESAAAPATSDLKISPTPATGRRQFALAAFVSLGLLAAFFFYLWRSSKPQSPSPSSASTLAVLPFKQLSAAADDHLGLGMADALITKLSNLKSLTVRPTSAILEYETTDSDALRAGQTLGVDIVLEGKIQRDGERLRVTVQMLKVGDQSPMWAESFDESFTNIFAVQDSISRRVADAVSLKLNAEEKARLAKRYTDNTDAYQAYIRGRYFWNKRTSEGLDKAIEDFRKAIELDPAYALAYSGLADCYNLLSIFANSLSTESYPKGKAAALKALEIDESLAEAHCSLGYAKMRYDWDWAGAEAEFQRALELNPGYVTAHHWYGEYLMFHGRKEEALARTQRALEMDPFSIIINNDLAWVFFYTGDYDRCIEQADKTLEMDTEFIPARLVRALAYEEKGLYKEALAEYSYNIITKQYWSRIAHLYAVSGNHQQARRILQQHMNSSQFSPRSSLPIAGVYAGLGEPEQAFEWLEKAYQQRQDLLVYLKIDPRFQVLANDDRFHDLLQRIGLEDRPRPPITSESTSNR